MTNYPGSKAPNASPQGLFTTGVSSVPGSKDDNKATPTTSRTIPRDEYMRKIQQSKDELLVKHPDLASDPALSLATHAPGMAFVAACQEHLDATGWERFNAAMGRYVGQGGPPSTADGSDVFNEVRTECRALLDGRAELQAQWDGIYGDRETWKKVYNVAGLAKRARGGAKDSV